MKNEILLYGEVGQYWDIDPKEVVARIKAFNGEPVNLRICSMGGDVFSGLALYNNLRSFPNVTASVDGIAASIASVILLGASRVTMPSNGFIMLHDPSLCACGNVEDIQALADLLQRTGSQIAGIYAAETGADAATAQGWMSDETWFDAPQALAAGLIDEITDPLPITAQLDLGRFTRTPTALRNQLKASPPQRKRPMTKIIALLRELKLLDVADTEDEETVATRLRAAIGGLLTSHSTLEAQIKTGLEARAKTAVEAAVADGRVAKTVHAEFIAAYIRDEAGTVAILNSLPRSSGQGTAPLGFGGMGDRKTLQENIAAEPDAKKRLRMMTSNWAELNK